MGGAWDCGGGKVRTGFISVRLIPVTAYSEYGNEPYDFFYKGEFVYMGLS